ACSQGQLNLAALHHGSQHAHADLESCVGAFAIARMHLLVVVQPAHHVFDVQRHLDVVVHATSAGNHTLLGARHGSPAAARQHFRETFRAVDADLVLAPPIIHFGNVRGAGAAFHDAAHAVGELNESTNIVG